MPSKERIIVYILRRDLRLADNPTFSEASRLFQQSQHPFTHLLPIYTFASNQIETSGFIKDPHKKSPYREARSQVGGFWRCGPLRAKFVAESVWDLKGDLKKVGSDLKVRVGTVQDVVRSVLQEYKDRQDEAEVSGVWMTSEEGVEEKREEREVRQLCAEFDTTLKVWTDEKYYVDDRDLPFDKPSQLPDVFTSFRKQVEPLRDAPRKTLNKPTKLPPLPSFVPPQFELFTVPDDLESSMKCLTGPLSPTLGLANCPEWPMKTESAHPFLGGSGPGHERVKHLIQSGSMTAYKDTRNGMLGTDFSTKLSAWLAVGALTAREVHWYLIDFEDGVGDLGKGVHGYGKGENKGTAAVRFELLWRDYMRLCTRKFGASLFRLAGFRNDKDARWNYISSPFRKSTDKQRASEQIDDSTSAAVMRFLTGRTGTGLIDASQRELFLTGYTSNRARQNVASYLSKHLGIDWRIGAEWYECNLIDYDVSSNYGNWQYVAGVGNDPRGSRVFNPIKQALDYDPKGEYIRAWVPELRNIRLNEDGDEASKQENLMGVFQAWRLPEREKVAAGLDQVEWVKRPLVKIDFSLNRRGGGGGGAKRGGPNRGGRGKSGGGGGGGGGGRSRNFERRGMMDKAGLGSP